MHARGPVSMIPKSAIRTAFNTLYNPAQAFKGLSKRTLEDVVGDYVKLVLFSGVLAAIASFLYAVGNAAYLQLIKNVAINYLRLSNYYLGISVGTFFFYLFAGTFLFFLCTVLIMPFVKKVKYTHIVM